MLASSVPVLVGALRAVRGAPAPTGGLARPVSRVRRPRLGPAGGRLRGRGAPAVHVVPDTPPRAGRAEGDVGRGTKRAAPGSPLAALGRRGLKIANHKSHSRQRGTGAARSDWARKGRVTRAGIVRVTAAAGSPLLRTGHPPRHSGMNRAVSVVRCNSGLVNARVTPGRQGHREARVTAKPGSPARAEKVRVTTGPGSPARAEGHAGMSEGR